MYSLCQSVFAKSYTSTTAQSHSFSYIFRCFRNLISCFYTWKIAQTDCSNLIKWFLIKCSSALELWHCPFLNHTYEFKRDSLLMRCFLRCFPASPQVGVLNVFWLIWFQCFVQSKMPYRISFWTSGDVIRKSIKCISCETIVPCSHMYLF